MAAIKYISTRAPSTNPLTFTIKGGLLVMRFIIGTEKLNSYKADEFANIINGPFFDFKGQIYSAFCNVNGVSYKIKFFLVVLKE